MKNLTCSLYCGLFFFCILLAILEPAPSVRSFFYFLFYLYYSPTEIFLFSIFASTTPFHSEIDKLVKSEKLIGFKAVRYLVLKELHFILCLTSLRLFIKQMQKKMYLPAPKKTLRVCLRRLNWQLSEL